MQKNLSSAYRGFNFFCQTTRLTVLGETPFENNQIPSQK